MGASVSTEYDIVVDIDNIRKSSFPILLSENLQKRIPPDANVNDYSKHLKLDQTRTVVSVLGLFNRGKTFLLNNLADTSLPSSTNVETKGLSFLMPSAPFAANMILLDTAGSNSPIQQLDDTALASKKATEMFLQDIVFEMSDVLIVVVNELTWSEQEFLSAIYEKLQESDKKYKKLYVVHNFVTADKEMDLVSMWQKRVLASYPGDLKKLTVTTSDGQRDAKFWLTSGKAIYHVCLGNHNYLAQHNKEVFQLLRDWIKGHTVIEPHPPFHQWLILLTSKFLREYCKDVQKVDLVPSANDGGILQCSNRAIAPSADTAKKLTVTEDHWSGKVSLIQSSLTASTVQLVVEGDQTLSREKITYEGYRIVLSSGDFLPQFDVIQDQDQLHISVELPGVVEGVNAVIDRGLNSVVVISGRKILHYNSYNPDNEKPKEVEYDKSSGNTMVNELLKRRILNEVTAPATGGTAGRRSGAFELRIIIPNTYEAKIFNFTMEDGVGQLTLFRYKKEPPVPPTKRK